MIWLLVVAIVLVGLFGLTVFRGAPYVPSRRADVRRAFGELYPLTERDLVVDIGSGDGVILRQAAERGARAVGFELNPVLVVISRLLSSRYRGVMVHLSDYWFVKFPDDTTLVYTFGESRDIKKMYQKIVNEATRLGRPLYFMSYGFTVPNIAALRSEGPMHLYEVQPLQPSKA